MAAFYYRETIGIHLLFVDISISYNYSEVSESKGVSMQQLNPGITKEEVVVDVAKTKLSERL